MQSRSRCITKEAPQRPVLAAAFVLLASLVLVAPAGAQGMPPDVDNDIMLAVDRVIGEQEALITSGNLEMIPGFGGPMNERRARFERTTTRARNNLTRSMPGDFKQVGRRRNPNDNMGMGMEQEFDDGVGMEVADSLNDLADAYVELNDMATAAAATMAVRALDAELAASSAGTLSIAPYSFLGSVRPSTNLVFPTLEVVSAAEKVRDVAERGCDQTAFGFNAGSACIVFEAIFAGASWFAEYLVNWNADIDSAEIRGAYDRAGDIFREVLVLQVSSGDTSAQLASVLRVRPETL